MKRFFIVLCLCGILPSSYLLADPPTIYRGSDKESFQKFKSRYLKFVLQDENKAALATTSNGCWAASLAEYGVVGIVQQTARSACWSYCKKTCTVKDVNGTSAFVLNFKAPSSELVWCATISSVDRITLSACNTRNGTEHSSKYLAKNEQRRLKSREYVWCATISSVDRIARSSCNSRNGSEYSSEYLAKNEQRRLKGREYVWCATISSVDRIARSSCNSRNGSEYSSEYLAKNEQRRLEEKLEQTAQAETSKAEKFLWGFIKDSNDPGLFKAYLKKYPDGEFVIVAESKIKELVSSVPAIGPSGPADIPNLEYGDYYALVIGNNDYELLPDLKTAVNDATKVASVLQDDYGFSVKLLKNATRVETVKTLARFRKTVGSEDSLLIYYAGHGNLDVAADEGYWLPVDAGPDDPSNWLQNDTVVAQIRAMDAKHVMIVADSCFSGTLTRAIKIELRTPSDLKKIVRKKARTALTSGGLEPVLDSRGGDHSVFAKSFISLLRENTGVVDAHQLFSALRSQVSLNSSQIPEYGNIHEAGHDGGDFLFVRQ